MVHRQRLQMEAIRPLLRASVLSPVRCWICQGLSRICFTIDNLMLGHFSNTPGRRQPTSNIITATTPLGDRQGHHPPQTHGRTNGKALLHRWPKHSLQSSCLWQMRVSRYGRELSQMPLPFHRWVPASFGRIFRSWCTSPASIQGTPKPSSRKIWESP